MLLAGCTGLQAAWVLHVLAAQQLYRCSSLVPAVHISAGFLGRRVLEPTLNSVSLDLVLFAITSVFYHVLKLAKGRHLS